MNGYNWCEAIAEIPAEYGEVVAEVFQEEGAGGVILDDPGILNERAFQDDEYFGEEFNLPDHFRVRAYFPVDDRLGERLTRINDRVTEIIGEKIEFTLKQVREEDWAEAWKQYFKPEHIGKIVIKPSWEEYFPAKDEMVIELDPGMAFGTGTHPTTRLCVKLLQEVVNGQTEMLDIGAGSGVLALTGAKLEAKRIVAVDIDPLAVRVAQENINRNQMEERIDVYESNLLDKPLGSKFNLVVANIITNAILELIPGLREVLEPEGVFVASGIIVERFSEVEEALVNSGFRLVETLTEDGWIGLVAKYEDQSKG